MRPIEDKEIIAIRESDGKPMTKEAMRKDISDYMQGKVQEYIEKGWFDPEALDELPDFEVSE